MKNKIIAVFGGSFNPPSISHIRLAKQIIKKIDNIEKIIFVPVSTKYNKQGLAPDIIRFNMLKTICNNYNNWEVSKIEIDSSRQLYTIETLNLIKNQNPNKDIYFIMGTDNLKEIETWHKADVLLQGFKMIILERDNDIMENIINNSEFLKKYRNTFVKLENIVQEEINSTHIRQSIKLKKSIKGMVPKEIEETVIKIYQ